MILKFITKSSHNRGVIFLKKNSRNSLSFFIEGDVIGTNSLYEYHIQKINASTFNIKCIKCDRYLVLRNQGIPVLPDTTVSGQKCYVYDPNVTEEQLLNIENYSNPYHRHTLRCTPICRAKHTKKLRKKRNFATFKESRRNIDLTSTFFNRDFNIRLFSIVGRNGNENKI